MSLQGPGLFHPGAVALTFSLSSKLLTWPWFPQYAESKCSMPRLGKSQKKARIEAQGMPATA